MTTKKQVDQESLRRLMRQKKEEKTKRIEHPLARYNSVGQLYCAICQTAVKSNVLWDAHLMSRLHKQQQENQQRQELQKNLKRTSDANTSQPPKAARVEFSNSNRLPLGNYASSDDEDEEKKTADEGLPADFFSAGSVLRLKPRKERVQEERKDSKGEVNEKKTEKKMAEVLPEGFFDDPLADAQVRQVPYKAKIDEELESFQKAIKEMTQQSEALIDEEDEQNDTERILSAIDDQMIRWQRVNQLELRQEGVKQLPTQPERSSFPSPISSFPLKKEEDDEEDDIDPDNEALMWRSKRRL